MFKLGDGIVLLGYLGPRGTFSFEVAREYIEKINKKDNLDCELKEYRTIADVIVALKNDEITKAIVPIENSIQGGVTETIDSLIENDGIFVNKEVVIKVNHNLMANRKYNLNEIKEIYSHPQAIYQCQKYIEKNLKNTKITPVSSTAFAAKEIEKKDYYACIANKSCIEEYNLVLLDENIQDSDLNKTKFWILSKNENKKGEKMSLIFSCKHEVGALYHILKIFNDSHINLTKIESRPSKHEIGEYIFLVDIDVNNVINDVLDILCKRCKYLKILGRY